MKLNDIYFGLQTTLLLLRNKPNIQNRKQYIALELTVMLSHIVHTTRKSFSMNISESLLHIQGWPFLFGTSLQYTIYNCYS